MHILAVHGAGMGPGVWGGLVPHLAAAGYGRSFQAVALPGHLPGAAATDLLRDIGEMAAWIREKMPAPEYGPVVLLGHSLGAAIALTAAASAPEKDVAAVVALGCGLSLPVNPALLSLAAADPAAAREKVTAWSCDAFHPQAAAVRGLVADLLADPPAEALAADLAACEGFVAPEILPCPLLVVAGARDRMVPAAAAAELANRLAGEYAEIEAGHMLPVERAPETAQAIVRFLKALVA